MVLRGCWHGKMSWPIRIQEHSYQVCLSCGIKRLFDEKNFRAYGPYSYDLNRLINWEKAKRESKGIEIEMRPSEVLDAPSTSEKFPTEHRSAS